MQEEELIKKFRQMPWRPWLKRQFPVLVGYLMIANGTKKAFAKQGIKGEWPIILFERGVWYENENVLKLAGQEAEKYVKKLGTKYLVKVCLSGYKKALREVNKMSKDKKTSALEQYKKIIELLEPINASIWTAHASEVYFNNELKKKLANQVSPSKLDEYIGDIGFPKQKNAHALMVGDVLAGMLAKELHEKYAWLKSRIEAGFSIGYTLAEMKELRKNILDNPPAPHKYPPVPVKLKKIVQEFRNIVYLRTLRTDSLFEIYFRAEPIFARLEKELGVDSIKYYLPEDVVNGKLKRYEEFAVFKYYDDIIVTKEKIVKNQTIVSEPSSRAQAEGEIKGMIAWRGKAQGRVRKILRPSEAGLLQTGEILVTNMTIPAYLLAMKKAVAFVTDEGGTTCHAAILAREMKKPCIIGTEVATKFLKDGDMVEVDAENGVVRKL